MSSEVEEAQDRLLRAAVIRADTAEAQAESLRAALRELCEAGDEMVYEPRVLKDKAGARRWWKALAQAEALLAIHHGQ